MGQRDRGADLAQHHRQRIRLDLLVLGRVELGILDAQELVGRVRGVAGKLDAGTEGRLLLPRQPGAEPPEGERDLVVVERWLVGGRSTTLVLVSERRCAARRILKPTARLTTGRESRTPPGRGGPLARCRGRWRAHAPADRPRYAQPRRPRSARRRPLLAMPMAGSSKVSNSRYLICVSPIRMIAKPARIGNTDCH